jgi:hypothetical protein
MPRIEYSYVCIVPLDCGLPDGSVVHYEPGDVIPTEVLGRAAGHLILADKVARLAVNVYDDPPEEKGAGDSPAAEAAPSPPSDDELLDVEMVSEEGGVAHFPARLAGGIYQLSDGTHVRGKGKAEAAQAELTASGVS